MYTAIDFPSFILHLNLIWVISTVYTNLPYKQTGSFIFITIFISPVLSLFGTVCLLICVIKKLET